MNTKKPKYKPRAFCPSAGLTLSLGIYMYGSWLKQGFVTLEVRYYIDLLVALTAGP